MIPEYNKRIVASYLSSCTPQKAYEWLETRYNEIDKDFYFHRHYQRYSTNEYNENFSCIYEYILLKRRHKIIDLGIARYGSSPISLRKVFLRGDIGIRCAALQNPAIGWPGGYWGNLGWIQKLDIIDILRKQSKKAEIEAFATNQFHKMEFFEEVFFMKGCFKELSALQYQSLVELILWYNPLFTKDYEPADFQAQSDLKQIYSLAWNLTKILEPNEFNAGILTWALRRSPVIFQPNDLDEIIKRWQRSTRKEVENTTEDIVLQSEYLVSLLEDSYKSDTILKKSEDIEYHLFFFRRLSPSRYENWASFFDYDLFTPMFKNDYPIRAYQAILQNENIWKDSKSRSLLEPIAIKIDADYGLGHTTKEKYQMASNIMRSEKV